MEKYLVNPSAVPISLELRRSLQGVDTATIGHFELFGFVGNNILPAFPASACGTAVTAKGHPGATTISAGLAAGEMFDCSGEELIASLAVGYEVCGRMGLSLRHHAPRKLIHGHGTWQSFGAAAATAKLLRLDRVQAAHATCWKERQVFGAWLSSILM